MNSGFGGAQPVMQDSVVLENDGSLGPHADDCVNDELDHSAMHPKMRG
jgi:hypothetical protein